LLAVFESNIENISMAEEVLSVNAFRTFTTLVLVLNKAEPTKPLDVRHLLLRLYSKNGASSFAGQLCFQDSIITLGKIPLDQSPLRNKLLQKSPKKRKSDSPRNNKKEELVRGVEHPTDALYHLSIEFWEKFLMATLGNLQGNLKIVATTVPVYGTKIVATLILLGTLFCSAVKVANVVPFMYESSGIHYAAMKGDNQLIDVISRNIMADEVNKWLTQAWTPFKQQQSTANLSAKSQSTKQGEPSFKRKNDYEEGSEDPPKKAKLKVPDPRSKEDGESGGKPKKKPKPKPKAMEEESTSEESN
jgi:hypothetical protein